MYKPSHTKILCEVNLGEKKTESGLITTQEERYPYLKAKVLGVGDKVLEVKEGDELIVFSVYHAQIFGYEDKKLIFVDNEQGNFFKL